MSHSLDVDRSVEQLLRRDRAVVAGGLVAITLLTWAYLAMHATGMGGMGEMAGTMESQTGPQAGYTMGSMPGMAGAVALRPWTAVDAVATFAMWAVMMVAMMTPSATPVVLLYARVCRRQGKDQEPLVPVGAFYLGYLLLWAVFSAGATGLQWALEQVALLSPMLVSVSPRLSGLLLIVAGVYQFVPSKHACLQHCRSPVEYLSRHWRSGTAGAVRMGVEHGWYCLGCCWALMLLLFVGGVMNLLWIGVIAALVLAEKVLPWGRRIGLAGGAVLLVAGILLLI